MPPKGSKRTSSAGAKAKAKASAARDSTPGEGRPSTGLLEELDQDQVEGKPPMKKSRRTVEESFARCFETHFGRIPVEVRESIKIEGASLYDHAYQTWLAKKKPWRQDGCNRVACARQDRREA